jgi:prophage DNA circulation protein
MAWRDGVFQGRFRSASFNYEDTGLSGGRRVAKHLFPKRDTAEGEDMGRQDRSFTLSVFIVSPDFATYTQLKTALIAACETKGPGTLIHPTMGTMNVWCEGYSVAESVEEMGRCNFQLKFWDPGTKTFTAGALAPNQAVAVDSAASALSLAALDAFAAIFSTLDTIAAVMASVLGQIEALAAIYGLVSTAIAIAQSTPTASGVISGQVALAAAWSAAIAQLQQTGQALMAEPLQLGQAIQAPIAAFPFIASTATPVPITSWAGIRQTGPVASGPVGTHPARPITGYSAQTITQIRAGLTQLAGLGLGVESVLDGPALPAMTAALLAQTPLMPIQGASAALMSQVSPIAVAGMTPVLARQIAAGSSPASIAEASPVPGVTPSRVQMAINQIAVTDLVRQTALAQAAEAVASNTYATVQLAEAARDDISSRLDLEMQLTASDTVYQALQALRIAVVRQINATIATLPTLSSIVLPQSVPALVLAHRLYDNPAWADDIVARNDIPHGGFVPAGIAIEVLSDVG